MSNEQDQSAVEQNAQEPVAAQQQEEKSGDSPDYGSLIAESKKYRTRAQESGQHQKRPFRLWKP